MKKTFTRSLGLLSFFCLLHLSSGAVLQGPQEGYHDFQALTGALKQVASDNPQIAKLISLGRTLEGRDVWMLQLAGTDGPPPLERQALLICANLEGDHVIGSEVALGLASYLVRTYGKDDTVTDILNKRTFYIVPRLNPDGAELFFSRVLRDHPGNLRPRDDDYDWLVDEDGPEDLNGDGWITLMRVKDKEGDWTVDEKDPRLMIKKEAGTPVDQLYSVYPEGLDEDGDGLYNEDGPGGFNINRNFPHNFGYSPRGWGVYAASEPETRALIDFMTRYDPAQKTQPHKNICGILLFSKFDNLAAAPGIECGTPTFPEPPRREPQPDMTRMFFFMGRQRGTPAEPQSRPRDPQPKITDSKDKPLFERVSREYKKITGIRNALSEKPAGSLLEWGYFQFGVPTFSANLWSLREEGRTPPAKTKRSTQAESPPAQAADRTAMMRQFMSRSRTGPSKESSNVDEKWLKWIDEKNNGEGFIPWTEFEHEQLGKVEIGGFRPYLRTNPPADQIPSLSESHARFALYLAGQFAEITMETPRVKKLASRLFELKVKLHNRGKFPYATAMGQRTRNINPIVLRVKFEDEENMKLFAGSHRVDTPSLDAGSEKEYTWYILSPPGKKARILLWARNGRGASEKTVILE